MIRNVRVSAVAVSARNSRNPLPRLCEACPRLERGDKLAGTVTAAMTAPATMTSFPRKHVLAEAGAGIHAGPRHGGVGTSPGSTRIPRRRAAGIDSLRMIRS